MLSARPRAMAEASGAIQWRDGEAADVSAVGDGVNCAAER